MLNELTKWIKEVQDHIDEKNIDHPFPVEIKISEGRKYYKIIRNYCNQDSVFCFVDKTTGDILKANSWKSPARGIRGNIITSPNCYCEYGI